jgi:hypothetical protein
MNTLHRLVKVTDEFGPSQSLLGGSECQPVMWTEQESGLSVNQVNRQMHISKSRYGSRESLIIRLGLSGVEHCEIAAKKPRKAGSGVDFARWAPAMVP